MNGNFIVWSPGVTLDQMEQNAVEMALKFHRGNKTAAAASLGVSPRTIDNKLQKYAEDKARTELADAKRKADQERFLAASRGPQPAMHISGQLGKPMPLGIGADFRAPAVSAPDNAAGGHDVESAPSAPSQPGMPVPKRPEIQSVLPTKAAAGGKRG